MRYLLVICLCGVSPLTGCTSDDSTQDAETTCVCNSAINNDGVCFQGIHEIKCSSRNHVLETTTISYTDNPPACGDHYARWAKFQDYTDIVPRGNWVHNLEHGGVVFLYQNDLDPQTIATFRDLYTRIPDDAVCGAGKKRALLSQDPELEFAVAVVAWQWVYKANCVDEIAIMAFVNDHRNHAPEDLCTDGTWN